MRAAFDRFLERLPGGRHRRGVGGRGRRAARRGDGCCGSASARMPTLRRARRASRRHRAAASSWSRTAQTVGDVDLPAPGEHNVLNALAALGACEAAGCRLEQARRGAGELPARRAGASSCAARRDGVRVFDDYAHHATEVEATLRAARALGPQRLVAVFQPHLYSRTLHTHRELGRALALADVVVVLDVYPARELPEGELAGRERQAGRRRGRRPARAGARSGGCRRSPRPSAVAGAALVEHGDLVVTLGAGDVDDLAGGLVERLREPA